MMKQRVNNLLYMSKQIFQVIDDGFSSDEEFRHEEILVDNSKKQENQKNHREEVKFKIPPPQEIKVKSYSLKPDIVTGWTQKQEGPVPVPLCFQQKRIDLIVSKITSKRSQFDKMRVCYLGPRFQNTFYAWYDQNFQFPYSNFKAPKNMKFTDRAFCGQHWDAQENLIFDSIFESGNLDCVIQVDENEYDLYLRVDSNTRGHLNWYNFKIKNMQKLKKYKLNICNLQKHKTLYNRGMKPYIFSYKKYEKSKKGWEQGGDSLKYQQRFSKSMKILNLEYCNFCKLSFEIYSEMESDTMQIAYCIPYTYTQLITYLNALQKKVIDRDYFTMSNLCTSLGGLPVPIITITQNRHQNHSQNDDIQPIPKKCIVVSGRVHPGESNSSYLMEGFLEYLCGNSKQARQLRSNFIFKVVPMLNPDGVCLGNYRTGISGKDFNREYRNPDKILFPEIYSFKKLVSENKAIYRENLLMFMDFHGHSTKKNVFMYGPEYPIIRKQYYESRIFPKIISDQTNMFRYYSCSFKITDEKRNTARAIFLRNLYIPFSFTIEASNGSFYDHQALKDHPFNSHAWVMMGKHIGKALSQYCQIIISSEKNKMIKKKERENKMKKNIKIRSTSKSKPQNNFEIRPQSRSIKEKRKFSFVADSKYIRLLDEIKELEEKRAENAKDEDDVISEGSSDGQGQKDDLPTTKLNLLYQTIKNKKSQLCEKFRSHKQINFEEQEEHEYFEEGSRSIEVLKGQQDLMGGIKQNERQIKTIKNSRRIGWFKNKKHESFLLKEQTEAKKSAETPKIINFNFFCLKPTPQSFYRKKISISGNKSLQLYSEHSLNLTEKLQDPRKFRGEITSVPKETRVLDLSSEVPRTQRNQSQRKEINKNRALSGYRVNAHPNQTLCCQFESNQI